MIPTGKYVTTSVAGESVSAFVPNKLPPRLSRMESSGLGCQVREAELALSRLQIAGQMIPSMDWLIYAFIRREALLSSEIEGIRATLTDLFSYEHLNQPGDSAVDDIEDVANYVNAINHAFDEIGSPRGLPLSIRLLNQCHLGLMQGVRGANKQPGEIRTSQNWIGGSRPGLAKFVPPPPLKVQPLLGELETWWHKEDALPPLLRIAASHLQFETIHPYLDGNGRIGRMLITLLLAHWGLLTDPLLYLSLHFKQNQAEYYARLGAVRLEGDWTGWFEFFLSGVSAVASEAADTASALHKQVDIDRKTLHASSKATVSAIQLFEKLPENPVISMPRVVRLLGITKPTATKAIGVLKDCRIIEEIGVNRRDRRYKYSGYIDLLE